MQAPILLYQTSQTNINVEVTYLDESFWLSQKATAQLFGVDSRTINEHLQNIFNSLELEKNSTNRKIRIVQMEGKREVSREIDFYNFDAIKSEMEFDKFRIIQDREYLSDFDRAVLELKKTTIK